MMQVARRVTEIDEGAVPEAAFEEADATRPYHLNASELARLDRLVRQARFDPEQALADAILAFGDERLRGAAAAHLLTMRGR